MRFHAALLAASAVGLMLAASPASAQGYDDPYAYQYDPAYQNGPPDYQNGPNEEIIITGPDFFRHRPYPSRLGGRPPEEFTLVRFVNYSDLDLKTSEGIHELRQRVRDAATDICGTLASRYPMEMAISRPCYRDAVNMGLTRANMTAQTLRRQNGDWYAF